MNAAQPASSSQSPGKPGHIPKVVSPRVPKPILPAVAKAPKAEVESADPLPVAKAPQEQVGSADLPPGPPKAPAEETVFARHLEPKRRPKPPDHPPPKAMVDNEFEEIVEEAPANAKTESKAMAIKRE